MSNAPGGVLDPLQATQRIADSYRRYLITTFAPRHPVFHGEFVNAVSQGIDLTRGPYLQATAPFTPGCSVRQLIDEGVLDRGFRRLGSGFPLDRPLHLHQEQAVRKVISHGRNLVVSTGTGSGKTETFLVPILDHLFREARAGTLAEPGVRALLLYPMNALANDQLKRLRRLLAEVPDITFGRYTGETKQTKTQALSHFRDNYPDEPELANELHSREQMQESPPHLLLTNFAMLEYLLLRPHDHRLFDGGTGGHWRFIVLDEAHVYDGAKGAEVAMLLRRVRDRVLRSERGRLRCFATSATLGRGEVDHPQLTDFASKLFDETFEWLDDDPSRQDVVIATRQSLQRGQASFQLADEAIYQLRDAYRCGSTATELAQLARQHETRTPDAGDHESAEQYLHRLLADDERLIELQRQLGDGTKPLRDLASRVFPGPGGDASVTALVELAVAAKENPDDSPLLPARYHFFARALEGAFVCLHGGHDGRQPRLRVARHAHCPSCSGPSRQVPMFELGICRHCRAVHLIGKVDLDGEAMTFRPWRTKDSDEGARRDLLLLNSPIGEEDEDEAALDVDPEGDNAAVMLCPGCGALAEQGVPHCACTPRPAAVEAILLKPAKGATHGRITTCRACRVRDRNEPVGPLLTGNDAPVAVIATDLYQEIPPGTDSDAQYDVGEGRKLLVFADSRQDAAFFAPYLDQTYHRGVQRRLIADAVATLAKGDLIPQSADLVRHVYQAADRALVFPQENSAITNRAEVSAWLMEELLGIGRRNSLEGSGILEISVALGRAWRPPEALLRLGFTADECSDLVQLLLTTVRQGGAISALDQTDLAEERYAPRNREVGIRREQPGNAVISWCPGRGGNRRIELIEKVLAAKRASASPLDVLQGLWQVLTDRELALVSYNGPRGQGKLWRLDSQRFEFRPLTAEHRPYRCDTCGQLTWRTVAAICPTRGCAGTVAQVDDLDVLRQSHYHRLYRELQPIGMEIQEHTAQWTAEEAARIQDEFVRGKVNALSCSTTFELGVDVGEVQAVLLRNMPPSPANYVQRAGRAGRRVDSAALVVTFAQRRNHDRAYFANPIPMIDGTITPPVIKTDNAIIVRRHMHSVAFAAFERKYYEETGAAHRNVGHFFLPQSGTEGIAADDFLAWLRTRPSQLGQALRRIVPAELASSLGLDDWRWVDALVEESDDEPTWGWLTRAHSVRHEIERLDELIEDAARDKNPQAMQRYQGMRRYLADHRQLVDFLASRNVLPKYGFPVDVVELDVHHAGDGVSAKVELQRDLQLAISEYALGIRWSPPSGCGRASVWRRPEKEWPRYQWAVCAMCGRYRQDPASVGACPVCQSAVTAGRQGTVVEPVYGFRGKAVGRSGKPARCAEGRSSATSVNTKSTRGAGAREGTRGGCAGVVPTLPPG
ncbi:MAG: DEAD/DEAH box helicase [Acidimicrobiales bacterium]